jgi:hypothetical protein
VQTPADLVLPSFVASTGGAVALSFVGERSTPLTVALSLLQERLHHRLRLRRGVTYHASAGYLPLTGDVAHLTLAADCLDEHAVTVRDEILAELFDFAAEGPREDELAGFVSSRLTAWSQDPSLQVSELYAAAHNDLLGAPSFSRSQLRQEYEELTPISVAASVSEILPTAILIAPTGGETPDGFVLSDDAAAAPLPGRRYRRRGTKAYQLHRASRIVGSKEGVSFLSEPPQKPVTVRFDETVAVLRRGHGRLTLVAANGNSISLDTPTLTAGERLLKEIEHQVPANLFIPLEKLPGINVLDLVRAKIGFRTQVQHEIAILPEYLQPGEHVVNLAQASRRMTRGLLVLTDRRLLYLSTGQRHNKRHLTEVSLTDVTHARRARVTWSNGRLVVTASGKKRRFAEMKGPKQAAEFAHTLLLHAQQNTSH